jgi:hypothetical protein
VSVIWLFISPFGLMMSQNGILASMRENLLSADVPDVLLLSPKVSQAVPSRLGIFKVLEQIRYDCIER